MGTHLYDSCSYQNHERDTANFRAFNRAFPAESGARLSP